LSRILARCPTWRWFAPRLASISALLSFTGSTFALETIATNPGLATLAFRRAMAAAALIAVGACASLQRGTVEGYRIEGDAIAAPLAHAGDAVRGREVLMGRDANCLLCHEVPETGVRFMGNLAPSLSGIGVRMSAGQLRLRLVDSSHLNPETIMPSYYRVHGLNQVAHRYRDKPILSAQQIEDVVAYLLTLR
jgi:sulfur-oxidizing protein SoxX